MSGRGLVERDFIFHAVTVEGSNGIVGAGAIGYSAPLIYSLDT